MQIQSRFIRIPVALSALLFAAQAYAQGNGGVDTSRTQSDTTSLLTLDTARPQSGSALPSSPTIIFTGSSRVYSQLADRQGSFQQTPEDFVRWEFAPSVAIYGIPFTVNVLLSTEQTTLRQNINSVSLDFDYNKLQGVLLERALEKINEIEALQQVRDLAGGVEHLRDSLGDLADEKLAELERISEYSNPEQLREMAISQSMDALDRLGIISASEKFFINFPSLSVGVTYPQYTPLTLGSVPVTGVNLEWNPGKFYIAFAGGGTQRAVRLPGIVEDSVRLDPTFKRNLYAARIGYGRLESGNVILTGIYTRDDESSLPLDSNGRPVTPMANYVMGLSFDLPIVENMLNIAGEISGSLLTGDIESAQIVGVDLQEAPEWLLDFVDPRISSAVDWATSLRATLRIPETDSKVLGSVRFVGPAYVSLGVPALRNDQLRYDARIEQRFVKRQILITGNLRRESDNVFPWKESVTSLTSYGIGFGLNFRRYPWIRFEYSPIEQRYSGLGDVGDIVNNTSILSAQAGYNYVIADVDAGTMVNASLQETSSFQGLSDYGVTTLTALQSVNFKFPLQISGGFSLSQFTAVGDTSSAIISFDIAGAYTAFDTWMSGAGITVSQQDGQGSNLGFFLATSVPVWDYGTFDIRAERNVFRNFVVRETDFNEFLLTATVSTQW